MMNDDDDDGDDDDDDAAEGRSGVSVSVDGRWRRRRALSDERQSEARRSNSTAPRDSKTTSIGSSPNSSVSLSDWLRRRSSSHAGFTATLRTLAGHN